MNRCDVTVCCVVTGVSLVIWSSVVVINVGDERHAHAHTHTHHTTPQHSTTQHNTTHTYLLTNTYLSADDMHMLTQQACCAQVGRTSVHYAIMRDRPDILCCLLEQLRPGSVEDVTQSSLLNSDTHLIHLAAQLQSVVSVQTILIYIPVKCEIQIQKQVSALHLIFHHLTLG